MGAGVAGATLATLLARSGVSTLLAERSAWPRSKVCGGCVNARAASVFKSLGVTEQALGAVPLTHLNLGVKRTISRMGGLGGYAISRSTLDGHLVQAATDAGANFLPETVAKLSSHSTGEPFRDVELVRESGTTHVKASIVVIASGLASDLLRDEAAVQTTIRPGSRIGAGCLIQCDEAIYPAGEIHMAVGDAGYLGLTRVEGHRLNLAAAVDRDAVRTAGSLPAVMQTILSQAGMPTPEGMAAGDWKGTPELTRSRQPLGADRLILIGDSCGYVEPFTGEGMAWAATGAVVLSDLITEFLANSSQDSEAAVALLEGWQIGHSRIVKSRQRVCRGVSALLKRPALTRWTQRLLGIAPFLASPIFRHVNQRMPAR